ncbi:DUF1592 domain-containing protein [Blastopirellula sp. JC732]|uniref:DUF1592 domain-containing protein n=1 Tax=Blastopirellula sediminis TaxID=2894196 RepID=A0A9X1MK45_9BACT|nr:DUF1592 domain-containing protein [Blastopirellula sediminis]MCC9608625.1 DUF1592 domain-containing protein [Blastopirellula sediminis]MCC9628598.1 DUF1592 domain-containing protein [Blastopirellula sediminis]
MMKTLFASFVLAAVSTCSATAFAAEPPVVAVEQKQFALLQKHCTDCHVGADAEAGFRVDDLPLQITDLKTAARWQKVLNSLNSGEMPPEGEPAIDKAAKANFLEHLANAMVDARSLLADQKGVITMRRLNRREYRNSLRELLGVEINVNDLPADTSASAFDTVGSNLYMSSTQFEQYLRLGREALNEAFDRQAALGVEKKVHFEAEEITPKVAKFIEYQVDARERAENWIKEVDAAVARPENAAVIEEIKAGPLGTHRDILYRNWKKIAGAPAPESFGFQTGENNADKALAASRPFHLPYHRYYMEQPAIETGAYLAASSEHPAVLDNATFNLLVPFNWPVGNYVVRFRIAATEHATPDRRFIEFGINPRTQQAISVHEVTGTMEEPQIIELPLTMTRANAERANRSLFLREKGTRDNWEQALRVAGMGRAENDGIGQKFALWVDWMEIERVPDADQPKPPGIAAIAQLPLDDKSAAPQAADLHAAFEQFAKEAFRGDLPSPQYVDQLVQVYQSYRDLGEKPSDALKETLAVVLASPMFLYHSEPSEAAEPRQLTDRELANRLSYFLWGSPADRELQSLADAGKLQDPKILDEQVTRLLDDPRSQDFVDAFAYQWLGLDRLDFFQVNLQHHPRFDNSTRQAACREIYETVGRLVAQNESLTDLLSSDYVVINAVLANYYGIEGVHGDHFRQVSLPPDSPRGGLLGMAAVHLMGSNGDTSNPVERGAWVLRKLLHDPPPPAPANVPQLARLAGKPLTTQQRLIAHQEEPQCASCHRKIDPIGFGLENFDAVGIWRTEDSYQALDDNGKPIKDGKVTWQIDPAGAFHNGPSFANYLELREKIAAQEDAFARGMTEALIQYALGRPIGFSDEPLIDDIVKQAREQKYAARSFVHALVQSKEFHSK